MKNKKILLIVIFFIVGFVIGFLAFKYKNEDSINSNIQDNINSNTDDNVNSDKEYNLTDDYIAIFQGGSGERIYKTYVFKDDKYYYINVTSTTESWGSTKWNDVITKKGSAESLDEIFRIAEENYSNSFVFLPSDEKPYSIEEYKNIIKEK